MKTLTLRHLSACRYVALLFLPFLFCVKIFANDGQWKMLAADGPAARAHSAVAYYPGQDHVILFGGRLGHGGKAGDTWVWHSGQWQRLLISGPESRDQHAMVYSRSGDRIILFGGRDFDSPMADTWSWDGLRWQEEKISGPGGRYGHAMVSMGERILLYGGRNDSTLFADVWAFQDSGWTRLARSGPAARHGAQMCYLPDQQAVLLYGGLGAGEHRLTDTWRFDGQEWQKLGHNGPYASIGHLLVTTGSDVYLIGGNLEGKIFNEIHRWDGTQWQMIPDELVFSLQYPAITHTREAVFIVGEQVKEQRLETWMLPAKFAPQESSDATQGSIVREKK